MSIRLIAADVDSEEGVMLHLDFTYTDTSDCLVSFSFTPYTEAHVRYNLAVSLLLYNTILQCLMYDMIWQCFLVRYQSQSHTYYDTQY